LNGETWKKKIPGNLFLGDKLNKQETDQVKKGDPSSIQTH
jgi:hypothetical protein